MSSHLVSNVPMKRIPFALLLALAACLPARAALYTIDYTSGFNNGGVIPDGNVAGWSDTRTLSGIADLVITDVNVKLNISGSYNGDLFGYLVHGSGFAILLNRVGAGSGGQPQFTFGYATSGFNNIKLDDSAIPNIHTVQNPVTLTAYASDGGTLASFNNLDPNGSWTIFFADMASGDSSTVMGWSLEINAVPEPVNLALIALGGILATAKGIAWLRSRRRLTPGGRRQPA